MRRRRIVGDLDNGRRGIGQQLIGRFRGDQVGIFDLRTMQFTKRQSTLPIL